MICIFVICINVNLSFLSIIYIINPKKSADIIITTNDFGYKNLQSNFFIQQLRANGQIYREIKLFRCWPSEVGGINFDMGSSEFVTFDVTLTFDHLEIITGI